MANILLLTKGTFGDIAPLLAIGAALQRNGHNITVFSHCDYQPLVEQSGMRYVAIDSPHERSAFLAQMPLLNTTRGSSIFFEHHCLPYIRGEFELLCQHASSKDVVIVSRHLATVADLFVAESFGHPVVRIVTAPQHVHTMHLLSVVLQRFGSELNYIRSQTGLPAISNWDEFLTWPAASIASWPAWFDPSLGSARADIAPVGFLTYDRAEQDVIPSDVKRFLDDYANPVLIFSGTADLLRGDFTHVAVEACVKIDRPAIVVSSTHGRPETERARAILWASHVPFASVLPRCSAIIHHGGLATISRSVLSGTPQLILPRGAERPYNGSLIANLGVGDCVPYGAWQADPIAEKLEAISTPDCYRRCTEVSGWARSQYPAERASEIIDEVIQRHTNY